MLHKKYLIQWLARHPHFADKEERGGDSPELT